MPSPAVPCVELQLRRDLLDKILSTRAALVNSLPKRVNGFTAFASFPTDVAGALEGPMPADGESQPTGTGWIVPPLASICLIAMPLLGALLVIVAVLWVALPRIQSSLEPTHYGMKPAAYDELNAANSEHLAILRIAQTCLEGKNPALLASHPFARLLPQRPPPATVADQDPLPPRLAGYFDAYLHLSADIANARAQLADEAVTGYLVMQLFQWTIVATGMFTTILISVAKDLPTPKVCAYLPMAITAIVLSALGTSVATLNSFYTPRISYEQNQRSLASLQSFTQA